MKGPLLLARVRNEAFGSIVSQYDYTYDAEGRRTSITRSGTAMNEARTDDYAYNPRGELVSAMKRSGSETQGSGTSPVRPGEGADSTSDVLGASSRPDVDGPPSVPEYAYQYDDIGNRITSVEPTRSYTYTANNLNQYVLLSDAGLGDEPSTSSLPSAPSGQTLWQPLYDLDGNQTLIRTSTGDWQVTYNGENRPVLWTRLNNSPTQPLDNSSTRTLLRMSYDFMGRRVELIETEEPLAGDGPVVTNLHHKFVYDNYLCIQRLSGADDSVTDTFEWDPTEPVATRPLFWQLRGTDPNPRNFFYTHDGNKNVSEVISYQSATGLAAHYEYAPFGETLVANTLAANVPPDLAIRNPWRFSSEYAESTIDSMCNFNFRLYNFFQGGWIVRDPLFDDLNPYCYVMNSPIGRLDILGLKEEISLMEYFRRLAEGVLKNQSPGERFASLKILYRGCVGVTEVNLGATRSFKNCYNSFELAENERKRLFECKSCPNGSPRIFSVNFDDFRSSDGIPIYKENSDGRVSIDEKVWREARNFQNRGWGFDFGFLDDDGFIYSANGHHNPGGRIDSRLPSTSKPMVVFRSSREEWKASSRKRIIWCVQCSGGDDSTIRTK